MRDKKKEIKGKGKGEMERKEEETLASKPHTSYLLFALGQNMRQPGDGLIVST